MNNKNDHTLYEEIPVTLKLKDNVAEVVRILALCYNGPRKEDFNNFISEKVTKIVITLSENPQEPPYFPDSFKRYVKELLLKEEEE